MGHCGQASGALGLKCYRYVQTPCTVHLPAIGSSTGLKFASVPQACVPRSFRVGGGTVRCPQASATPTYAGQPTLQVLVTGTVWAEGRADKDRPRAEQERQQDQQHGALPAVHLQLSQGLSLVYLPLRMNAPAYQEVTSQTTASGIGREEETSRVKAATNPCTSYLGRPCRFASLYRHKPRARIKPATYPIVCYNYFV